MKTFTGTSLLGYFAGIIVATISGTVFDAVSHTFFFEPQPDFWSRFMFVAPGDLPGLGFFLIITVPVYGLLFRFLSGATFCSRPAAFFAGLVTSLVSGSVSVYAITDATTAVFPPPRKFWVHLVNLPGGFFWFPIGVSIIAFFLILLIGKLLCRRTIS
jgi:hypothetical protein